jgi:molybdate transport system substrate-binding protein
MNTSIRVVTAGLAIIMFLAHAGVASAAEIKVLSAVGMKEVMDDLGPTFERASGHKLTIMFGTLGEVVKRVQGGEAADVVIVPRQGFDTLVADGKAPAGNVTVVARSGIVLIVRKGAPKPDISSPDALKRALLAAKSVTYGNPAGGGASGIHFAKVLDRLGIADEMKAKTIYAKAGSDTAVLVADGKAEIGVNQLQVVMPVAGIDIVGPLPGDLQATTIFVATIMTGAGNAAASKALVDFLRTPDSAKVIKAKGMEPG